MVLCIGWLAWCDSTSFGNSANSCSNYFHKWRAPWLLLNLAIIINLAIGVTYMVGQCNFDLRSVQYVTLPPSSLCMLYIPLWYSVILSSHKICLYLLRVKGSFLLHWALVSVVKYKINLCAHNCIVLQCPALKVYINMCCSLIGLPICWDTLNYSFLTNDVKQQRLKEGKNIFQHDLAEIYLFLKLALSIIFIFIKESLPVCLSLCPSHR